MVKLKAHNLVGYFTFFDQISYIMTFSDFFSYFERGIITCFIVALFRFFFFFFFFLQFYVT